MSRSGDGDPPDELTEAPGGVRMQDAGASAARTGIALAPVLHPGARRARERVDGVLLLDKPAGLSSNVALQRARRLLNAAKAGHTGTLDPLATGLLPLCFGEATKFAQALLDAPKTYLAVIRFGSATTTGDAEGEFIGEAPVQFALPALHEVLAGLVGVSEQVPPAYSALKHRGRSQYEYARAGVEVPRLARPIAIDELALIAHDAREVTVRVSCSKGTYVRVLAETIAQRLGTLGHLGALRRLASGPFRVEAAVTLEALEAMDAEARKERLLAIDAPLAAMTRLQVDADAARELVHGRQPEVAASTGRFRAYGPGGGFLGIVEAAAGRLRPVRLVDPRRGA